MNTDNVPFKYLLGMWKSREGYPMKLDVLYELYVYVSKNMKNQEFSDQTFNGIWCDVNGVANWKDTNFDKHLKVMLADGTFVKTKEAANKTWYKISDKHNPFL